LPVYPLIAIITSYGILHIKNHGVKSAVLGFMIVFSCLQFSVLTFGGRKYQDSLLRSSLIFGGNASFGFVEFERDCYRIDDILRVINECAREKTRRKILVVSLNSNCPDTLQLRYWLKLVDRHIETTDLCFMNDNSLSEFDTIDIVILKLPHGTSSGELPRRSQIVGLLRNNSSYEDISEFMGKSDGHKVINKLYEEIRKYPLRAKIDTTMGYDWVIYGRQQAEKT
jgi:hypothetical protein